LLGAVLGLNITSLLAGLGIGGLAIAFAAQESIKDLFGSFTIFLDKPFIVGDIVKVGEIQGTVEKVGIRSTRVRTPGTNTCNNAQ
jgi:MscS family membrane protein